MTAIQTVPAGVARILTQRAQDGLAKRKRWADNQRQRTIDDPYNRIAEDAYQRARVDLAQSPSAEKLAQEWLDGLARMGLVPKEGAL